MDDHVLEPPSVWQDRVPAKHRAAAPRLVRDGSSEQWVYEDRQVATLGLAAVAGKRREQFSPNPITYDEMRPGCYDSRARIEDMDRAGILASLCFPSFARFCGQVFYEARDKELALLCVQAYNDWMIDEWCGSVPGRFIPLTLIPLWDPRSAAAEIERCAAKGSRAFAFSENPTMLGLPSIHDRDRYWDPVWSAAQDAGMVVCIHQGSSSHRMRTSADQPELASMAWNIGATISGAMLDWLLGAVLLRFPSLKIAFSEGDIGWMPYFLNRAEQVIDKQRFWASEADLVLNAASGTVEHREAAVDYRTHDVRALFREHIYGCFIDDEPGVRNIHDIGIDNVMVETDYPHSDSTWPNSLSIVRAQLARLSDVDAYKVMRGNAEKLFRFHPVPPTKGQAR